MPWTSSHDLRKQVERLWERGIILSAILGYEPLFPQRLKLRVPTSSEISEQFDEVRHWIGDISAMKNCRITTREFKHRVFGQNSIPTSVWVDTVEDAVSIINRTEELERFIELVNHTKNRQPSLLTWIARKPLRALSFDSSWGNLLSVIEWMRDNPQPGIYVRQVDISGIDTKFLEQNSTILSELLDIALPDVCAEPEPGSFVRKYGFSDQPNLVRFRILDKSAMLLPGERIQDVTLDADTFATLDPKIKNVFITENKTNFLSFTELADSMVVFGGGYGLDALCKTPWLHNRSVYYWGDIDSHGFTILDRARTHLPQIRSILMDEGTLRESESLWVAEPSPSRPMVLKGLDAAEQALFDKLVDRHFGFHVRLEQERIPWGYAWKYITSLVPPFNDKDG